METRESSALIYTGVSELGNSPGSVVPGFFNQVQRLNRDITVLVCYNLKPRLYLDGFSGTGIRAIRVEKEADVRAVLAERNWKAYEIVKQNLSLNNVNLEAHKASFEGVVSTYGFDFVDVDPYGSAFPYIDTALHYVRNHGYIGITATDLSTLSGSMRVKSVRRYGGFVVNDRMKHEMGIRLLLGYIARRSAGFDRGIVPIISLWKGHYYRVIFQVNDNLRNAADSVEKIVHFNKKKSISAIYGDLEEGPIWSGNLQNEEILGKFKYPEHLIYLKEYVGGAINENLSLGFMELSDLASFHRTDIPSMGKSLHTLRESGLKAERTGFSTTGIKISGMKPDIDQYWGILSNW